MEKHAWVRGTRRWLSRMATRLANEPIDRSGGIEPPAAAFHALVENANEAVFVQTAGCFAYLNAAALRLFGAQSEDQLLHRPVLERFTLEHSERVRERTRQLNEERRTVPLAQENCVRLDGRVVPIEVSAAPITYQGQRGAVVFARDISERVAAERALHESEEYYRTLFEQSPFPMWVFDPKTLRILGVNRNATLHYGYSREEFLRMTLRDLRPPEDVPVLDHIMAEVATDAPPRTDLVRHRKKDGSVIDVEVTGQHVRFLEHSARIVVVNDVTERRQLEQQLQQAQKIEAVGQLAGGIAHDFNNILTVINNSAELAIDDLAPWHPVLEHLRAISDAGKRAAALTTQLLAFSRQQPRQAQVLTLPHVVKGVEPMLRRLLGENISISVHHDQSPAIVGDRAQLEQVLMNLAVNARDAMPRGGQLTIETGRVEFGADTIPPSGVAPGRYALLSVTDNGCGMDAWTRARVFEPFFTTKEPGKGTGLGLSTVYGIVKQNGGGLSLYSEPNQGSTFRVYLPEAAAEAEGGEIRAAEAAPAGRRSGGCETVLLVEDEPQVRVLAQRILQQAGYTVLAADGANQALALAEGASRIDLLVTDVVMPDMSGRELAERLAALRPDLNVLYMSGYTADAVVHHGILDPGIAFISKPFSGGELRRQVRDVLDRRTGAGG